MKKLIVICGMLLNSTAFCQNMPKPEEIYIKVANNLIAYLAYAEEYDRRQTNDFNRITPEVRKDYDKFFHNDKQYHIINWTGSVDYVEKTDCFLYEECQYVYVHLRRKNAVFNLRYNMKGLPAFVKKLQRGDEVTFSGTLFRIAPSLNDIIAEVR